MRQALLVSKIAFALMGAACALLIALSPIAAADPAIRYAKPGGATTASCDSWVNACDLQYASTR